MKFHALLTKLCAVGVLAGGVLHMHAQPTTLGQIGARALTPQEIKVYGLPADTQTSGGLFTVGMGQPVYLEAQMLSSFPVETVTDVTWALVSRPAGSGAMLVDSPLPDTMPIYNPGDRGFYSLLGRKLLRPDAEGPYMVRLTITTNGGSFELTRQVTGSRFLGNVNSCLFCHSGGYLPDKFGPWSQTLHSKALTNFVDGWQTDHFAESCLKCHTTGFDTHPLAVNDGFDDIWNEEEWEFPHELVPGNYAAMPQRLRDKSNVQCEMCHGAGSQHALNLGNTNHISVSFSAGDCSQCHDAPNYHVKSLEWGNSLHAVSTRYPTGENRESCVRCHSTPGFVDFIDGVPEENRRTAYEAITCAACHDPHGEGNPHMLRSVQPVTLMDEVTTVTDGGLGQMCMQCHISRRDAVSYVETSSGSSRFGPHRGPQTDMLVGANAITYGKEIPSSAHAAAVKNTCVACHLQEVSASQPGFGNVGGHTFRNHWDGNTPEEEDDVSLVGLCADCHGPIESFDFKRADYDGDGKVDGVQTEVKRLMDQLGMLLPPIGSPNVSISSSYTKPQLRAGFNYMFVLEDGSHGVHNLAYTVGLLRASIADLTDDADHDGLSDLWENEHFGSITAYDGHDDPDNDGVNNALELGAGTNPRAADSDNDGVSDLTELQAGSDPTNENDLPGLVVQIYNAAEVEFASQVGKTYRVQRVSEVTGTWLDVGATTNGTGENISMVISTRSGGQRGYVRVVELP